MRSSVKQTAARWRAMNRKEEEHSNFNSLGERNPLNWQEDIVRIDWENNTISRPHAYRTDGIIVMLVRPVRFQWQGKKPSAVHQAYLAEYDMLTLHM